MDHPLWKNINMTHPDSQKPIDSLMTVPAPHEEYLQFSNLT